MLKQDNVNSMFFSKREIWLGQTIIIPFQGDHPDGFVVAQIGKTQENFVSILGEKYFFRQERLHGTLLSTVEKDGGIKKKDEFDAKVKEVFLSGIIDFLQKLQPITVEYEKYFIDNGGNIGLVFRTTSSTEEGENVFKFVKRRLIEVYKVQAKYDLNDSYKVPRFAVVIGNIGSADSWNANKGELECVLDRLGESLKSLVMHISKFQVINFLKRTLAFDCSYIVSDINLNTILKFSNSSSML